MDEFRALETEYRKRLCKGAVAKNQGKCLTVGCGFNALKPYGLQYHLDRCGIKQEVRTCLQ